MKKILLLGFLLNSFLILNLSSYQFSFLKEIKRMEFIADNYPAKKLTTEDLRKLYNDQNSFKVVLEPLHRTIIAGEVTSPVVQVNKRMGESIQKGELLIKLDDKIFISNFSKAKAKLEKTKVQASVMKRLYHDKSTSLFELKDAEDNYATATADFDTAEKALNSTHILAPYDGKVVRIIINLYELVQPGKEIIEIVDDHLLYAKFLVPSSYYSLVNIGENVKLFINETGELIDANVVRIAPIIDPVSGTIKIEAEINNEENKWSAGMIGFLKFDTTQTLPSQEYANTKAKKEGSDS